MDSATALQTIFTALPATVRKAIYKVVKILAAVITLALLVLPHFPQVGINLPDQDSYVAIATGILALLGHLADSNTNTDPQVDVNPAPEEGSPTPPEGVTDPAAAELAETSGDSTQPENVSSSTPESNTPGAVDPNANAVQPAPAPPAA